VSNLCLGIGCDWLEPSQAVVIRGVGIGELGGQVTPPGNLPGGQTWCFVPRFFRKKYFLVHRSFDSQQNH